MPGHSFNLYCSGCGTKHEVQTGAPVGGGLVEQRVCPRCQKIVSVWPRGPERCPHCEGEVEPWSGKVWFEPRTDPEADAEERFEGPCPKCGTEITLADQVGPDGTILVSLWD
jgi:RNA polymerase subunit RPABC4/transcription elongation factor Spt4